MEARRGNHHAALVAMERRLPQDGLTRAGAPQEQDLADRAGFRQAADAAAIAGLTPVWFGGGALMNMDGLDVHG